MWDNLPLEIKEHIFMFVRKSVRNDPARQQLNDELKQYAELYQRWNALTYVNYTVLLVIRKNIQSFMLLVKPLVVKQKSFI